MKSIAAQRSGLEAEKASLTAKLHEIEDHLTRLDKAEAALHGQGVNVYRTLKRDRARKGITEKLVPDVKTPTIKQMVLVVLEGEPNGFTALTILKKINKRYGTNYVRTSLSPQLSRLMQANQIHKRGKRWVLGQSLAQKAIQERDSAS